MDRLRSQFKLDYILIAFLAVIFFVSLRFPAVSPLLWLGALLGTVPTVWGAWQATRELRISIDTFNTFALATSFSYGDVRSAVFIVLMLSFARLLNDHTESRTRNTLEELLKLKPQTGTREKDGATEEIPADTIATGDILIVKDGFRVPVDGTVIFGRALLNEASVTGESVPVEKIIGDRVLSSTLNESGTIKIRATKVGKDSTIERMAALVKDAAKNKSRSEKLADRFASIYLPILLVMGVTTYLLTKNLEMTAALFLVACADDMAVAIPLAMTAALGKAAKRGVVIKGGEWIEILSKMRTLIVDKTGTLTYGTFVLKDVWIKPTLLEDDFWRIVGTAEKFSEHPIGRMLFKEAVKRVGEPLDPEEFRVYKGSGVIARLRGDSIAIGKESILSKLKITLSDEDKDRLQKNIRQSDTTWSAVFKNNKAVGFISVGDIPRPEAKQSILELKNLGIADIRMFTGDNASVARTVARAIGIETVRSGMMPEEKLRELETLIASEGPVAMVGDGVNDAASLARADVGIAMGSGGAAVSVEAADIVILNDDISRIPEMVRYCREVMSVIRWDMAIWAVSNVIGFGLVFTSIAGPALAALYNFATDFFPLINSARLFRKK